MVDQLFAGALEAVSAFFQGQQGGVADEDGGVGSLEHGVEVGRAGQEGDGRVAPLVEEDARVGEGGAAGGVGGDGAQGGERPAGVTDQKQRAHAALGGDGAAGQDAQARCGGESRNGHKADVGLAGGEARGALRGRHAVDPIAEGERV